MIYRARQQRLTIQLDMGDFKTTVSRLDTASLAKLFELGRDTDVRSPEASQEALEHLLSLPIQYALNQLPRELAERLRLQAVALDVASSAGKAGINTLGELLTHSQPPLEMLKFAKDFAKAAISHGKTIWPRSVCDALNYASYAAALVCWGERIGTLSDAELKSGFQKLASRTWVTKEMKGLFEQAAGQLSTTRTTTKPAE